MTRSIFDPTGDPERSGSRFLGPDADQDSHLPSTAHTGLDAEAEEDGSDDVVDLGLSSDGDEGEEKDEAGGEEQAP